VKFLAATVLALLPLTAAAQVPVICLKPDGTEESCQLRQCRALGIDCHEPERRPAGAGLDFSNYPGLAMQCGPITIIVTQDRKVRSTGLPDGSTPITVKDNTIYIDGHPCKPICQAPAEQRC
jgi:hypothetical protein